VITYVKLLIINHMTERQLFFTAYVIAILLTKFKMLFVTYVLNKCLPKSTEVAVNTSKFGRLLCRTKVRCLGNRSLPQRICKRVRVAVTKALVLWISA